MATPDRRSRPQDSAEVPERVLGRVILVTGPEEFLSERTVVAVRRTVREVDAEAEFGETTGDQLTVASMADLASPSLFSSIRCVVVRRLEDLPEDSVDGLLEYAASPVDEVAIVLVHSGGAKASGVLTKLRKLPAVVEVANPALKGDREFAGFVVNEFRRHRVRIDADAADHLVRAVGQDLRALSAAADQLSSDFEGKPVTLEMTKKYFEGRAEAKSFTIADAAMLGQTSAALEELRWALETGTPAVLVTSAFAGSLRGLARFASAPRGMRDADLAREVGVPPWKLSALRQQIRGWEPQALGVAIRAVARADAEIKGQAGDASYALERMVLAVTGARMSRA